MCVHVARRIRRLVRISTRSTLFHPQNLHQVGIIMFALQQRKGGGTEEE